MIGISLQMARDLGAEGEDEQEGFRGIVERSTGRTDRKRMGGIWGRKEKMKSER